MILELPLEGYCFSDFRIYLDENKGGEMKVENCSQFKLLNTSFFTCFILWAEVFKPIVIYGAAKQAFSVFFSFLFFFFFFSSSSCM